MNSHLSRTGFIALTADARPTPKTNMEFVYDLMNFSKYGALSQLFVIQAIGHYAEAVAKSPVPEPDDSIPFINPIAWHGCAQDILARWNAKYK